MANSKWQTPIKSGQIANGKLAWGFTLIELLVTIAIIGILSSLMMVNLQGFRERARDAARKKDLQTIQTAVEMYRSDMSSYPNPSLPNCLSSLSNGTTTYLKVIPCDPLNKSNYFYSSTGNTYTLYGCLENVKDSQKDSSAQAGCTTSFTVQSP
jgi:general secretion pathway protein G